MEHIIEVISDKLKKDEIAQEEEHLQQESVEGVASSVTTLALISEFQPCVLENVIPVECVDAEGGYFTLRFVRILSDMVNWRKGWARASKAEYWSRAQNGTHLFAKDKVEPWYPSEDGPPPYHPLDRNSLEFWQICDKILRWTQEACMLPSPSGKATQNPTRKSDHHGEARS